MGGEFTDQPKWDLLGFDPQPYGCGSKLHRRSKLQVLVHVSTYQGNPLWNSGFLSHG